MTLAATVQVALVAIVAPVSEMVAPPALAPAVPPQVSVSPLGVETTRPLGKASVNATPVSVVVAFGLVRVKVSVLVPLSGTEVGLKALAIDGGAATMTAVVALALGPPFRLIVWPVNTWVVDVPPELVSVTLAVKVPAKA